MPLNPRIEPSIEIMVLGTIDLEPNIGIMVLGTIDSGATGYRPPPPHLLYVFFRLLIVTVPVRTSIYRA